MLWWLISEIFTKYLTIYSVGKNRLKLEWNPVIDWTLEKNKKVKKKLKDKFLESNRGTIIEDYKTEFNPSTNKHVEVRSDIIFCFEESIKHDHLIDEVVKLYRSMEYTCEKSTISGGESIKLQSPTSSFKGDLGSITIPLKIYKNQTK